MEDRDMKDTKPELEEHRLFVLEASLTLAAIFLSLVMCIEAEFLSGLCSIAAIVVGVMSAREEKRKGRFRWYIGSLGLIAVNVVWLVLVFGN